MRGMATLVGSVILVGCLSTQAETLREQLQVAADASGPKYFACRTNIVAAGTNIAPGLRQIVSATNEPWQIRLMAGICLERIERPRDLQAMIDKDWPADPEYERKWEAYRGGPGTFGHFQLLVAKRYKEQRLWNYCIEMIWKMTSEHSRKVWMREDFWRHAVRHALQGTTEFELLVPVLAERIKRDVGFSSYETRIEFKYLRDSGTNTALPVVLELMPKVNLTETQKDMEMTKVINTMVQPQDLPLIEKFYADQGGGVPQALVALKAKFSSTNNPPLQPPQRP